MTASQVVDHRARAPEPGQRGSGDQLRRDIAAEVRGYAEIARLPDALLEPLVDTIRTTVLGCVEAMVHPEEYVGEEWAAIFRFRRGELTEGAHRKLLLRAYRIGGQIAWRHAAEYARRHGVTSTAVARSAEVIFAYLSAVSSFAPPAAAAASVAVVRARLLRMLLDEQAASGPHLAEVAQEADWDLHAAVRVVALRRREGADHSPRANLGSQVLLDLDGPQPCAVVVASRVPATWLATTLRAALPGWTAAIGTVTPIGKVRDSLRVANLAIDLVERGLIQVEAPDGIVHCADHLLTLTLLADDFLIAELVGRELAPLKSLKAYQRHRLLATLNAWFATRGRVADMAERLRVHPQTIRYRVGRLQELFGEQLADPRNRFDLELAVRATLLHAARETSAEEGPASGF
ncbi:PucR family transcriptional regulator [Actinokineospora iranica]|uniref:PucR C-terminal helix-turn-helix domain-containing protein n=1 Tax=Actinokineospora iranica TaxID=1271860 RepID=A0A1G6LDJ0_9PSEU|nr:helix-turn-helix domain-containing protein [Actinokineospora iranica]SDC41318.1 PucR C-terminal helix-turn-helix domain-containing protein [Actinokineospora iranica]